jgi:hypothetical protein
MHRASDASFARKRKGKPFFGNVKNLVKASPKRTRPLTQLFQLARIKRFHRARSTVPPPKGPFV